MLFRSSASSQLSAHLSTLVAVNVMLWSAADPGGKPGVAAWDLFRAEDSDKVRRHPVS